MNARALINDLRRQLQQIDPDRETCPECRGSGQGDYGPCPDCGGDGSWPHETYRHANLAPLDHDAARQADCLHLARLPEYQLIAAE